MCKGNCCCCHRSAEQPLSRDPSSSKSADVHSETPAAKSPPGVNEQNAAPSNAKRPNIAGDSGESPASCEVEDAPEETAVGGGACAVANVNNYLTIKELHDIEEEDDQLEEDPISQSPVLGVQKIAPATNVSGGSATPQQSPQYQQSHHQLQKCDRKKKRTNLRSRSAAVASNVNQENTTTCGGGGGSGTSAPRMQAEQGSIGDLQKYHNRYLRNRRHTLANVR